MPDTVVFSSVSASQCPFLHLVILCYAGGLQLGEIGFGCTPFTYSFRVHDTSQARQSGVPMDVETSVFFICSGALDCPLTVLDGLAAVFVGNATAHRTALLLKNELCIVSQI
jgi:hypothetical protein